MPADMSYDSIHITLDDNLPDILLMVKHRENAQNPVKFSEPHNPQYLQNRYIHEFLSYLPAINPE